MRPHFMVIVGSTQTTDDRRWRRVDQDLVAGTPFASSCSQQSIAVDGQDVVLVDAEVPDGVPEMPAREGFDAEEQGKNVEDVMLIR